MTKDDSPKPVTVSLKELQEGTVPSSVLEDAFGPTSLGILLVRDLPVQFPSLRHQVLSYASYLAALPTSELAALENPSANYLTGWSLGRETLRPGVFDTFKGSYYVNCSPESGTDGEQNEVVNQAEAYPDLLSYTSPNVWPSRASLPGFQPAFETLCSLIIEVAGLVARACDRYGEATIEGYRKHCLERYVRTSSTTKARLLHYFPPPSQAAPASSSVGVLEEGSTQNATTDGDDSDDWCATHVDHGCLTGLTSAMFIDESTNPPTSTLPHPTTDDEPPSLSPLPELPKPPSPSTGLYIRSRTNTTVKVSIPRDCLAFQTGEALEIITQGRFRAVPHFVRGPEKGEGGDGRGGGRIARNTLAVFTQPNLHEPLSPSVPTAPEPGGTRTRTRSEQRTFADFCREVMVRNR
ncbi:MAG: hypothetical protein M1837_006851 [Sclerophora amabilis]|nr:MAG: hypothetical protein M1837_006851 [Sclerophora amabilis]